MNKQLRILMAVALLSSAACINAAGAGAITVDVKAIIGVQNCFGGGNCSQSQALNAIGDPFDVDVKTANFTDLGTVTTMTKKDLTIPATVGAQSLYKFTGQDGKPVYLGLEMKPVPRRGTQNYTLTTPKGELTAGKDFNIVELYRYDDAKNDWLRNNVIFVETGTAPDPLPVDLSSDGSIKVSQVGQAA